MNSIVSRFCKGVIIALGFILPGISGGALAAILGIYERMLSFMAHLTKDFKRNFLFFLPVGIGGGVGIILLSKPLTWLLGNYQLIVLWGFAGAIVGSFPFLIRESEAKKKRDVIDYIFCFGALITSFLFLYFIEDLLGTVTANFIGFILAGGLIALGTLVPGLSPSNLLLVLELYDPMLEGFSKIDIVGVFLPMFIGGLTVILLFSKLMEALITAFHSRVYHTIIGLVIASTILIILPPVANYNGLNLGMFYFMISSFLGGLTLGYYMSWLEIKYVPKS